jgi:hypothetical protein
MSSIKLTADSGGGTFEIKAPSSGSNARVLTIPDSASGTVLTTTNPKTGNIIQVVQSPAVTTRTAINSTTYIDSGHSVTITPTAASSKILVTFTGQVNTNGVNQRAFIDLYRSINGGTFEGLAPCGVSGGGTGASNGAGFFGSIRADSSRMQTPTHLQFLDSPSYTLGNAIVYKLYGRSGGSYGIEIPGSNNQEPCFMMAMEVAG